MSGPGEDLPPPPAPEAQAPPSPSPLPTQVLEPVLVESLDTFYPAVLGPTLAQLQEKAAEDTLTLGDIAGYLAVEKALAEMREETFLTMPFEAVTLIAEELVGPARWGQEQADKQAKEVQPRDARLQDLANEQYPPEVDAALIAKAFLNEGNPAQALRPLLVLKDADGDDKLMPDGETPRLMQFHTLRRILARREERRK
jgi:hypothetical protein